MKNNSFLETIKAVDGEVFHIHYHQQRYESVLKYFHIYKFQNLHILLNPPSHGTYRCRVVYTLDGTITISYHTYEKRNITSLKIIHDNTIQYNKKSTNREYLNTLFEKKDTCDDVLIVKNGFITDISIANIAFFNGKEWLTPSHALLKGVTRQRYLECGKIREAEIELTDVKTFKKVALLNAMIDFAIIPNIIFTY
ncbi:aminotransferase class IV [Sulfurimonas sp. SAG-AH-194-I05]|nr:aminotransferase class IV [Sulfurimonas sp. SAG-AH-194-I05]MDF1874932.1 aminotransferase class IV [Sulfurimonas sp. SAG-AH-194-I05]